ncbi:protein in rhs element [Shigella sonnei]|nr:protein in rhs element [Shigella sonnei]
MVKKEHADGSVTQSQFDAVGRLRTQTDAAGRTTEYSPDVVTGLITRITTPDGRASAFYYNHHSQLTSATGPDGLEMRRKYDESGRLIQETAPDGDITRYRYDNPHSDLPCATEDATGSRKTMTWSRYGQLLTVTDCSGYVTRYDHDRFGQVTAVDVTDGAGRHFRLVLTTQAQRAEEARQQAISGGTEPSAFPDTLPGYTEYGRDNGIRLSAVWLTHDPEYPENLPAAPLVRYGWTPRGELAAVYDRSNTQVRSFTYDDKYRGRMVAHRHTGRPEIRYRYDSDGRVTEQLNPAGLSYTYQYEKDRITITDSLNRREVLHCQRQ